MARNGLLSGLEEEFRKNPELKQEDLDHLQAWMNNEAHLPKISDEQMVIFLHSCYFDLEATKKTIETCYSIRTRTPELFANMDPLSEEVQHAWKFAELVKLPKDDSEGNALLFGRLSNPDPEQFNLCHMLKLNNMVTAQILREEGTKPGFIFIFDITGFSLAHITRLSLTILKRHFTYVQEGCPLRMKAVHVINIPSFIDKIMAVFKPFLKKELINMLHFHPGGPHQLYSHISKELLPADYGGDRETMAELAKSMKQRLEDNRDWFLHEQTLKATGGRRRSSLAADIASTFKHLSID